MTESERQGLKEALINGSQTILDKPHSREYGIKLIDKYLEKYKDEDATNELFIKIHNEVETRLVLKFAFK